MTEQTQEAAPAPKPQITPEQEVIILRNRLEIVCAQRNEAMDRLAVLAGENAMLHAQLQNEVGVLKKGADAPRRGRAKG